MYTIKVWSDSPSEKQLEEICDALKAGDIMLMPTDTVYGIVCDALNVKAVDRICRLKGIDPRKNHLSVICSGISMAAEYARIDDSAYRVIKANVPGAFTFLLPAGSSLPKAFKGRKTVGIRIPDSETARLVAAKLGNPILTTSVEFEDIDYVISPSLMSESYEGQIDLMVEGEDGGTEYSTIVDLTSRTPEIVREGKGILI